MVAGCGAGSSTSARAWARSPSCWSTRGTRCSASTATSRWSPPRPSGSAPGCTWSARSSPALPLLPLRRGHVLAEPAQVARVWPCPRSPGCCVRVGIWRWRTTPGTTRCPGCDLTALLQQNDPQAMRGDYGIESLSRRHRQSVLRGAGAPRLPQLGADHPQGPGVHGGTPAEHRAAGCGQPRGPARGGRRTVRLIARPPEPLLLPIAHLLARRGRPHRSGARRDNLDVVQIRL